jgi:hypothetical protein
MGVRWNMSDLSFMLPGWNDWIKDSSFVSAKIGNASETNVRDYFGRAHAATESLLRQILFIGFRLNRATYADTNSWLYHNDVTPDRQKFPALFNVLYLAQGKTWDDVIRSQPDLNEIWALWLDYAKVIRNHIQHGIRNHGDEALLNATLIDKALLMSLDAALIPVIGGRLAGSLTGLSPRLPRGASGLDLTKLAGFKKSGKRPTPAADVRQRMLAIKLFQAISSKDEE